MRKYWEEPICGIYRISRRDSDKSYIGQSRDIFKRWKEHSNLSRKKLSCISSALKLHGLGSFVWEVIEECTLEELNDREVYWISYFDSMSPNGYNLTSGGGQGTIFSEEVRAKRSEVIKAAMTDEVRAKISEAAKARNKITCPYCGKEGNISIMGRWHFDNCKLKPQSLLESETSSTNVEQSNCQDHQQTSDN